ncbi:hypothetical protein JRQ81_018694 [Phrynocephalus forsythii]|uniref:Mitochondrial assembly of ribosomal large subunit protein 1 n=1 Tax=Phrynocephalus forsythii TaxID=171643 RepID=A0A9Q0XRG8_9SAUR|nr:hypothetical protein JRQ81_018694 [Phrynocephalus forsythii]
MWRWSRALRWPGMRLAGGPASSSSSSSSAAAAAGSSGGMRRSAKAARPPKAAGAAAAAAAARVPRFPSPGWRLLSGWGSSEPREAAAAEEESAGRGDGPEDEGGGGGDGQEPRSPPTDGQPTDPVPAAFTFQDIVAILRQENASDICVIQLPPEVNYSNHFIIVSGSSGRHLHAMAQYLLKMYKHTVKGCRTHVVIEGKDTDDWLCIDFGHTVVHFMLPETREVYELEKLWTLRSYDDQLGQMVSESLPDDFMVGLTSVVENEALHNTRNGL